MVWRSEYYYLEGLELEASPEQCCGSASHWSDRAYACHFYAGLDPASRFDPTFHVDTDLDPTFHFDPDPDPTFHFDPDPSFQITGLKP